MEAGKHAYGMTILLRKFSKATKTVAMPKVPMRASMAFILNI